MNRMPKYLMTKQITCIIWTAHQLYSRNDYEVIVSNYFTFIIKPLRKLTNSLFIDFFFA